MFKKFPLSLFVFLALATSCCRTATCDISDNSRTARRYFGQGIRCLFGKERCSRQVRSPDAFCSTSQKDEAYCDFIPLEGAPYQDAISVDEVNFRQPRAMPGDPGSRLPKLEEFRDPATHTELSDVFGHILFELDDSHIKNERNIRRIRDIAYYLQTHPGTYVFIEGHCDERGPEAYNLALGARRANSVRNALISHGAEPDAIFTISYGKERPIVFEHHEEAWKQNRRAEFKVYVP